MTLWWLLPISVFAVLFVAVAYRIGWRTGRAALKRDQWRRGYRYYE